MRFKTSNSTININGKQYAGSNITIDNGVVTIDGVIQKDTISGVVNVEVHGDVESIENKSGNITAKNVGNIRVGAGDVRCGDVSGSVKTGSGDVNCGSVGGNIKTGSGDVYHQ